MKKFAIILLALTLSGCGLFGEVTEKVVDVVDEYCTRSTFQERQVIRDNINNALDAKGHSITVTCAGDPAP